MIYKKCNCHCNCRCRRPSADDFRPYTPYRWVIKIIYPKDDRNFFSRLIDNNFYLALLFYSFIAINIVFFVGVTFNIVYYLFFGDLRS